MRERHTVGYECVAEDESVSKTGSLVSVTAGQVLVEVEVRRDGIYRVEALVVAAAGSIATNLEVFVGDNGGREILNGTAAREVPIPPMWLAAKGRQKISLRAIADDLHGYAAQLVATREK